MENKIKEPKIYLLLKITGAICLIFSIMVAIISATTNTYGDYTPYVVAGVVAVIGLFILLIGFYPLFKRFGAKNRRYMQSITKDVEADIYTTAAEIKSDGITTMAKAVKNGIKETMFCKHCGAEIERNSKFCKECGKQQ